MNFKYILGNWINKILLKLIEKSPRSLGFIPNGRFAELDILRSKEDIKVIFDVGANIGQTAISFKKAFPNAVIYSFEPVKKTYNILVKNLSGYSDIHPVHLALGSEKGKTIITLNSDSQINSLKNPAQKSSLLTEEITIETGTNYCERNQITYVDVLKMDTEGFEMKILNGFNKKFLIKNVKFIYCEIGFDKNDPYKTHFSDIESYLKDLGFITTGFYEPSRWGKSKLKLGFCNALFTNTNKVEIF